MTKDKSEALSPPPPVKAHGDLIARIDATLKFQTADNYAPILLEQFRSLLKEARTALQPAELVAWQYRVMFDEGSVREREWCNWHYTSEAYFNELNERISLGEERLETRVLYTLPQPAKTEGNKGGKLDSKA